MDEHSLFLELVDSLQREAGRIMDKSGKSDETISPLLDALGDLSASANVSQFFPDTNKIEDRRNIGVQMGPTSLGLVDVDLDCAESISIASYLLPKSTAIFGRASKRFSHMLFYSDDLATIANKAAVQFKDPNRPKETAMLLELRVGGGGKATQTVFPGSIHPSGEVIFWEQGNEGEPERIDGATLLMAAGRAAAACLFARYWPAIGARHDAALCLGGFLARGGMPSREAELFAEAVATAAGADREGVADTIRCVRDGVNDYAKGTKTIYGLPSLEETFGEKTARKCAEWLGYKSLDVPQGVPQNDNLPTILTGPEWIDNAVNESEAALIAREGVYQRLGKIVDVGWAKGKTADAKDVTFLIIKERGNYALQRDLSTAAHYVKYNSKGKLVPCEPPMSIVHQLKEEGRSRLPVLHGIINTPTLRADGTLLTRPGYDARTGMIFDPLGVEFPPIPDAPSRDEALNALAILVDVIKDFPFDGEIGKRGASRGVALAAILTAPIRQSLTSCPMFAFNSPVPGTGKSKLVDIAHIIAYGHRAAVDNWTTNDEENEKLLGAAVLSGRNALAIDNVERAIGGGLLCKILTQPTVNVRILGVSESPSADTTMFCTITGNNIRFSGDITRRVIKCRIDAHIERPETRAFDRDPIAYVYDNRPVFTVAVLTILRAYKASQEKKTPAPFGDYDAWSAIVRGALIWLGEDDPISTVTAIRDEDQSRETLYAVLCQWYVRAGSGNLNNPDKWKFCLNAA